MAHTTTDMADVFQPRVILMTGVAGFIASHVLDGALMTWPTVKVIGVDKVSPYSNIRNMEQARTLAPERFHFVQADVASTWHMLDLLKTHHVDTVMHFAAETHVDRSFNNAEHFIQNNIVGTYHLLEACRRYGKIERFYNQSTDECYGSAKEAEVFHTETSVLQPTNPYAASKAGAEMLAFSYFKSFHLPLLNIRLNNVYGPRQVEKLVPKFLHLLLRDAPLPIHGTGEQKRSFLYIADVVRAILLMLQRATVGYTYNIGMDQEYTVLETCETLKKIVPESKSELVFTRDRHFQDLRYPVSAPELQSWGWNPEYTLETGCKATLKWLLEHPDYFPNLEATLVAHPL